MAIVKVKSASRVIQILELLAFNKYAMQHKDVAEELDIPKGSLTKLLVNLVDAGYLSFDHATKTYKLGSRVLALANSYLSSLDIVQAGQPIIRNLVEKTGESCALVVPDENSGVVVHRQFGSQPMYYRLGLAARIPLYATAAGKAILAFLSKKEVERYLASTELVPLTHATITDRSVLLRELDSVRSERLAYCRQEQFEGFSAIAAPVLSFTGRVAAAITVMYLNTRSETIDFPSLKRALREASEELSTCLGFEEPHSRRRSVKPRKSC